MVLEKNFRPVSEKPAKFKQRALQLVNELGLERIAGALKKVKGMHLDIFYAANTHKPTVPFRAIVSERGAWPQVVSRFLQRQLSELRLDDPFVIPGSQTVVDFLRDENPGDCAGASVDVEDLFYSLSHGEVLESVKVCIAEHNDEMKFRSKNALSVESFLELLSFYLKSTFVGVGTEHHGQKTMICIGSVLSDIVFVE